MNEASLKGPKPTCCCSYNVSRSSKSGQAENRSVVAYVGLEEREGSGSNHQEGRGFLLGLMMMFKIDDDNIV